VEAAARHILELPRVVDVAGPQLPHRLSAKMGLPYTSPRQCVQCPGGTQEDAVLTPAPPLRLLQHIFPTIKGCFEPTRPSSDGLAEKCYGHQEEHNSDHQTCHYIIIKNKTDIMIVIIINIVIITTTTIIVIITNTIIAIITTFTVTQPPPSSSSSPSSSTIITTCQLAVPSSLTPFLFLPM
jgi:hypothetical protein